MGSGCEVEKPVRTIQDTTQVHFTVEFEGCDQVTISAKNKGDWKRETGFTIRSDGTEIQNVQFDTSPGDVHNWSFNLTPNLDIRDKNHTVTVTTYGNLTKYNFTRDINYTNGTEIPHTHIEDVKVTNGTIDGEPSTVAKVTLSNPSIQMYSTKLMVYTEGTDGSLYGASVAPGENRTITVELLEDRGTKVAGEARLYAGNISEREGGIDQVEFVGRAGTNTTTWNESYEPVKAPWRDDHYVYQNESIETGADRNGLVPDLSETQLLYAGAGVALVGLGGLKRLLT
ncbi:hypothetical protein SAMN04487949_3780 [Halogranum gelatinilyticum]|uniref:Uncharacterized protein n=2 Tax=Halogranum gelatinilyticum TaxID=660521 RepID=A0A1H0A0D1_9EURY|nr:hypothetical protein SAMN04487949_3780 [Halogranum gelatinilyticum]